MRPLIYCLGLWLCTFTAFSQDIKVKGTVADAKTNELVPGALVSLNPTSDTLDVKKAVTDFDGNFSLTVAGPGTYTVKVSSIGYADYAQQVNISGDSVTLPALKLGEDAQVLQQVNIETVATRVEQKGDTSEYNANAFKTNPDANLEDLVKKMPGITVENGTVKAQGEDVKKVLIDGKEFFGDDATMALKNLPAEVVDKIQVFDRLSDQAQFTGIDDGNAQKTINVVTKKGKSNGSFGKVYAGYGTDNRYQAGGNFNYFKDARRISILGLSNNINQQNFSTQDLASAMGGGSSGGGRSQGGGMRGDNGSQSLLTNSQNGITNTNSIGINYSDEWGKKVKFTGSYFFNSAGNDNNSTVQRNYFSNNNSGQVYDEQSTSSSDNLNHRANMRLEYTIDTNNSIIFSPRFSLQQNKSASMLTGITSLGTERLSNIRNENTNENLAYNFAGNLLYRHKFAKRGRTFSIGLDGDYRRRDGESTLASSNGYYDDEDTTINLAQLSESYTQNYTYGANLEYSEPVGKTGVLQFSYNPSFNINESDKKTYNNDASNEYTLFDTLLSNSFDNTYTTHRAGLFYRMRNAKVNFYAGANYQYAQLQSDQIFPYALQVNRNFVNVLPSASFRYNFSKTTNVRIGYRTRTTAPAISQLQGVIDNSNPLFLRTGNPNLKQSFNHNFSVRYGHTNPTNAHSFYVFVNAGFTNNYIGNSTLIAAHDTTLADEGITLYSGAQLSRPVNLNGYWDTRSLITYGLPVKFIKSNLNFNAGFNYRSAPGQINNDINTANTYGISGGVTIGSNISEKIDFTVGYNAGYNIVENTIRPSSNNNYLTQSTTGRLNWTILNHFVLSTDMVYTSYRGLSASFNQDYILWNAGLAYKFLKNNAAELRLSVFDILKQNNSIARVTTETYIEDSQTQVLQQYFMMTFTYNIRAFGGSKADGIPTPPEDRK